MLAPEDVESPQAGLLHRSGPFFLLPHQNKLRRSLFGAKRQSSNTPFVFPLPTETAFPWGPHFGVPFGGPFWRAFWRPVFGEPFGAGGWRAAWGHGVGARNCRGSARRVPVQRCGPGHPARIFCRPGGDGAVLSGKTTKKVRFDPVKISVQTLKNTQKCVKIYLGKIERVL